MGSFVCFLHFELKIYLETNLASKKNDREIHVVYRVINSNIEIKCYNI